VLHTVEAFNKTGLEMKLEARQLKKLRSSPPLKQALVIKAIFLEVSRVSGLGRYVFQQNFLEEIGNVRSITVRFFRTLVALTSTVLAKPAHMWHVAESIFGNVQEQLRLVQDLAQAASDSTALRRGAFEDAKEAAKLVLSQVSLSERKEEREAARMKRLSMMRNTGSAGAGPPTVPVQRKKTVGALVGLSRKSTSLSSDSGFNRSGSDLCGEELFELDGDELDAEVFDKFQMLMAAVKEDDVDTVERDLSLLKRPVREKETLQQAPDFHGYWKVAVSNIRRIREQNTQKVIRAALIRRDDNSEVLLHKVQSIAMYHVLLKYYSENPDVYTNWEGQTPLQVYMNSYTDNIEEIKRMAEEDIEQMLTLDGDNVSTCMRLGRDGRAVAEEHFSTWEDVQGALRSAHPVATLKAVVVPTGFWAEVLHYHLFHEHEVWEKGRMSSRAPPRLLEVWRSIRVLLVRIGDRNNGETELVVATEALNQVKALLHASKGPRTLDARQPYRAELTRYMAQLQLQSQRVLEDFYGGLSGAAAEELRGIPSGLHPELVPDPLVRKTGIQQSLRMDYELSCAERHADERVSDKTGSAKIMKLEPPAWVFSKQPAEKKREVLEDLVSVGMIEKDGQDGAFQLVRLAVGVQSDKEVDDDYHFQTLHWYAAWLRGTCEVNKDYIHDRMMEALGALRPVEGYKGETGNISFRKEAKGFPRICEKTRERMDEIRQDLQQIRERDDKDLTVDEHFKLLMSQTAAYICDIAGCTFIAEDPGEALAAFGALSGLVRPDLPEEKLATVLLLRDERRVQQGALLCDNFRTSEYFEVSFDFWINRLPDEGSIVGLVQFERGDDSLLPAVYLLGGSLCAIVGKPGKLLTCIATEEIVAERSVKVAVRLTGMAFSVHVDGREVGSTGAGPGFTKGLLGVAVYACGKQVPAADARVQGLRYKALDIHGKALQWHMISGAVQPVLKRTRFACPPLGEDAPLEAWGDGRCRTRVLRVKNLFHRDAQSAGGYRDLKMWVSIETPAGPLIAEVQLLLRPAFDEKKWMHLPYEYFRGSLDWGEYKPEPELEDVGTGGGALGALPAKGADSHSDISPTDEDMLLRGLSSTCALMYLKNAGLDVGLRTALPVA
jgi:hypothetical protein